MQAGTDMRLRCLIRKMLGVGGLDVAREEFSTSLEVWTEERSKAQGRAQRIREAADREANHLNGN